MPRSRGRAAVLLTLLLAGALPPPAASAEVETPAPPAPPPGAAPVEEAAYDPTRIEGPDAKAAALEAHRLLQAIAARDAAADGTRLGALNYLLEKLNPASVARGEADAVAAARIADTLATWIDSHGAPFPRVAEVLLPLAGQGPATLRDPVIRALQTLVRLEAASGKPSATAEALAAKLAGPDATEPFVRDAARALWQVDGKTLLAALVAGLLREREATAAGGAAARDVYLHELRSRVPVDFPALESWQKWWAEARDLSLDSILAEAERRAREEYALNWRQVLRRLRETGDAERFLLAVEDTLDGLRQPEVRLSAVVTLEDFAEWSAGARPGNGAAAGKAAIEDPTAALREKAVRILAALLERKGFHVERPEVIRAALAALRKYHAFIEKRPVLLADISRIIVSRLEALTAGDRKPAREDLLETIRSAGVLRVSDAMGLIESLCRDPNAPEADLEVLTAGVTALSRLGEGGLRPNTASLLIDRFRNVRTGGDRPLREFRRATITALAVGSEAESVRGQLLELFKGVLAGGEKDLRIPALLGLGTLARQKEAGAFEALREVLESAGQFATQETAAAIDSIAYMGGEAALAAFLRMLALNKEPALEGHVLKKVLSLIEAGGLPVLLAALEGLEAAALADDSLRPIESSVALGREPLVKDLLSTAKLDLGSGAKVEPWGRAALALARAYDLLGDEEATNGILSAITEVFSRERELKEKLPRAAGDLASFKVGLSRRAAVAQKLARLESEGTASLAADLDALLAQGNVEVRWCHMRWVARRLAGALAPEAAARLREAWLACLRGGPLAEGKRDPWEGFPVSCRERYMARVEAAGVPAPPAPQGGASPSR